MIGTIRSGISNQLRDIDSTVVLLECWYILMESSIKIGPLSISRRRSSYESDLELRYSLFPVQWDRNDSLCFPDSKNIYGWEGQCYLIVLGLLDRNCRVLCLLQNTTSGYTTFAIEVMLRSYNAENHRYVEIMSK